MKKNLMEFHQLECPFGECRWFDSDQVEKLRQSIEAKGQLVPAIVVAERGRMVLIDGYRRMEAIRRLRRDQMWVECHQDSVTDAVARMLVQPRPQGWKPLEEAQMIQALMDRLKVDQAEVARRLRRNASWVSRRLHLLRAVSQEWRSMIEKGKLSSWGVSRVLVPLARANEAHAHQLTQKLDQTPMSTRMLANWFGVYKQSDHLHRERLVKYVHLFEASLRDLSQTQASEALRKGPEGECQQALALIETGLKRLSKAMPKVTSQQVLAVFKQRLSSVRAQWLAVIEKEHR